MVSQSLSRPAPGVRSPNGILRGSPGWEKRDTEGSGSGPSNPEGGPLRGSGRCGPKDESLGYCRVSLRDSAAGSVALVGVVLSVDGGAAVDLFGSWIDEVFFPTFELIGRCAQFRPENFGRQFCGLEGAVLG